MQPSSLSTFQPKPSLKEAVPYSNEAMRQDLQRVRNAWDEAQSNLAKKSVKQTVESEIRDWILQS
jgi:hypothetical protein